MLGRRLMLFRLTLLMLGAVVLSAPQTGLGQSWTAERCWGCGKLADLHRPCQLDGSVCADCCPCGKHWLFTTDFVWMARSHARSEPLLVANIGGQLFNAMDTGDLTFSTAGGVRMAFTRELESERELEFSYLGIFDHNARQQVNLDPARIPPLVGVNYQFFGNAGGNANAYQADYQSDLHSGEANLRLRCLLGVVPFVGFRWLQLDEQLQVAEIPTPTNRAIAELSNNLYGANFGLQKDLWIRDDRLRIESVLKAGIFHNVLSLSAQEQTAAVPTSMLSRGFSETASMGELTLTVVWQPALCLAFRAGYSGLWLNDVALVADQVNNFSLATGQGTLQTGAVAFHGGHFGLELRW